MSLATHVIKCAATLCTGPVLAIATVEPVAGDVVLVVAGPFSDVDTLVEQSGGRIIGPASGTFGTFATSPDPTFFDQLEANGAWAVTDGTLIAQLCGVEL